MPGLSCFEMMIDESVSSQSIFAKKGGGACKKLSLHQFDAIFGFAHIETFLLANAL